ncbi:MAG: cohesin domain-containing protein, partial [Chloroflexota bacterium]
MSLRIQPAQFQNVQLNQTINFSIEISSDTPTRGAQVGLSFNPRLLNCISVSEGNFYKNWADAHGARTVFYPPSHIDNIYGQMDAAVVSIIGGTGGATGSGSLLSITCRVVGGAGNSAVSLLNWVVTDDNAEPVVLPVQVSNGWIGTVLAPTATPTATPSPTPTAVTGRLFLDPASPVVRPNTEFNLDLRLDIPVASAGMQFEASFDQSILQCIAVERGSFYSDWVQANPTLNAAVIDVPALPVCDNANGKIRLGGIALLGNPNGRGPSGSGVAYRIRFRGLTSGNSPITLSNVLVSDALVVSSGSVETTNPIPVAVSGAQITISTTAASPTPTLQTTANATQMAQTQTAVMIRTQTASVQNQTLTAGVVLTQTKAAEWTLAARGGQRVGTPVPTATMVPATGSLSVSPPQILRTSFGDEVFDVNIVLTIDKPTRAIQFKVKYDPAILSCVTIVEGAFYKDYARTIPNGQTIMVPAPRCDDAAGSTSFIGISVLGAAATPDANRSVGGAKGSGVVVTIQFRAKKLGSSPIQLTDVIVGDDRDQNVGVYNLPVANGNVYVGVTPPPQSGSTLAATQRLTPNPAAVLTGYPVSRGTPTVTGTPPTSTATSSAIFGSKTQAGPEANNQTGSGSEKPISGGAVFVSDVSG